MPIWQRSRPVRALALAAFAVAILAATSTVDVSGGTPAPIPLGGEFKHDPGEAPFGHPWFAIRHPVPAGSTSPRFVMAWWGMEDNLSLSETVAADVFESDGTQGPRLETHTSLRYPGESWGVGLGGVSRWTDTGFAVST